MTADELDALVEQVARAMARYTLLMPWDDLPSHKRNHLRGLACTAIDAVGLTALREERDRVPKLLDHIATLQSQFDTATSKFDELAVMASRYLARALAAETALAEWKAYADKLQAVLELIAGESADKLKVMQAKSAITNIGRPS